MPGMLQKRYHSLKSASITLAKQNKVVFCPMTTLVLANVGGKVVGLNDDNNANFKNSVIIRLKISFCGQSL